MLQNFIKKIISENQEKYYRDYQVLKEKVENSKARYQGKPIDFIYKPFLFTEDDLGKFREISGRMISILHRVIDKYKSDPEFRKYFSFSPLLEKLILKDPGYSKPFPMARFDFFYSEDDYIKFCEFNADGSSGMNEERVLQDFFLESELISVLDNFDICSQELFESWIDAVLSNYREYNNGVDDNPSLAIVDFEGEGVVSEFREFKERFIARGYKTLICDPGELEYRNNRLYYEDIVIDLIYRRATTGRIMQRAAEVQDLLTAYLNGDVCIVGGFVSQLIHNKVLFAVLHDKEKVSFLSSEDHEFIKKHIPKTCILAEAEAETRDDLIKNRNKYVLKPFDNYACHGVYVGKNHQKDEWKKIVKEAAKDNYLLQEYCSVPREEMPTIRNDKFIFEKYNYIIGLYMYNEKMSGFYVRTGRENIIGSLVESFTAPAFKVLPA